jgi:hypothetical protein
VDAVEEIKGAQATELVDEDGDRVVFEAAESFPSGLAIAHDGYGNFWVVDLTPDEMDASSVFFACHDAPVILFQSPNLGHFLRETFRMHVPPHASLVDDVHEDRLFEVWRTNPGVIEQPAALTSDDDGLRAFAATLDESFHSSTSVRRRSEWDFRGAASDGGPRFAGTGISGCSPTLVRRNAVCSAESSDSRLAEGGVANYHATGCYDGGPLDIHPDSSDWPN